MVSIPSAKTVEQLREEVVQFTNSDVYRLGKALAQRSLESLVSLDGALIDMGFVKQERVKGDTCSKYVRYVQNTPQIILYLTPEGMHNHYIDMWLLNDKNERHIFAKDSMGPTEAKRFVNKHLRDFESSYGCLTC